MDILRDLPIKDTYDFPYMRSIEQYNDIDKSLRVIAATNLKIYNSMLMTNDTQKHIFKFQKRISLSTILSSLYLSIAVAILFQPTPISSIEKICALILFAISGFMIYFIIKDYKKIEDLNTINDKWQNILLNTPMEELKVIV